MALDSSWVAGWPSVTSLFRTGIGGRPVVDTGAGLAVVTVVEVGASAVAGPTPTPNSPQVRTAELAMPRIAVM